MNLVISRSIVTNVFFYEQSHKLTNDTRWIEIIWRLKTDLMIILRLHTKTEDNKLRGVVKRCVGSFVFVNMLRFSVQV